MRSSAPPQAHLALQKVRQHQTILRDFARVCGDATDLQRLLDLACLHVARALGVAHSKVLRVRPDQGDLLIVAGHGWRPGVVGHARLGSDMLSPPGRAYQTRDLVRIGDLPENRDFRSSDLLKDHGICSLVNAPVAIDGVVWGVLEVDAVERDRFDDDDERFLVAFALVLALGVRLQQGHADRERTAVDLGRRLLQTETLLKEQNHRVHNNFQIILSILANRSHKAADAQIRAEFEGAMDRVAAVALAHDQLTFRGGAQTHVNAGTYVDALCLGLERATEGELHIERDAEPLELRADRAGPLGLILNELLTNAIKYAAKDRPQASIRVRLTSNGAEALLAVSDDGPGMGEPRTGSMGLKLVESLAAQLSGRLEVDSSSDGTTVRLYFPLVE